MFQAEIGSARCNEKGTLPTKGLRIRDFELRTREGIEVRLEQFRGRFNLVLLFLGSPDDLTLTFAKEVASKWKEFDEREARLLMVFTAPSHLLASIPPNLGVVVLTDLDGMVHQEVGAMEEGHPTHACYITDRFGEVFAEFRTRDGNLIPTVEEMLSWLDFIEAQCPECEPPEWPADAA